MSTIGIAKQGGFLLFTSLLAGSAMAGVTDIASAPLETSPTTSVLPNLMFVMDDSFSMSWDFLPDWVRDDHCRNTNGSFDSTCQRTHPPYLTSDFNSVYYNPGITYLPPLKPDGSSEAKQTSFTAVKNDFYGIQDSDVINLTTQYPDSEWCTDTSYTDCLRNGNYVLPNQVGNKSYMTLRETTATGSGRMIDGSPIAPTTSVRNWGPHYYSILPGEYCDNANLRNCQLTQTAVFSFPSKLRWCSSTANAAAATPVAGSCQAVKTATYAHARYPTVFYTPGTLAKSRLPARTIFSISLAAACSSTKQIAFQALTVNGVNLLGRPTSLAATASAVAVQLARNISIGGYSGSSFSSPNIRVNITAPLSAGDIQYSVNLTRTANSHPDCTATIGPTTPVFSGYQEAQAATPATYSGAFVRTDIVPGTDSYAYPGTAAKASTRTDCVGVTCTYREEMSNFANWWTYYRTRMQMAKSSTSIAFGNIGERYRVGYMTINRPTDANHALNISTFNPTQKAAWYDKLRRATPNNATPLRAALARAGRIFAGKLNGSTGGADPMQYSCQQNFTILFTDGYWNGDAGYKLNGTSPIGNQDGSLARPLLDGTNTPDTLADTAAYYYLTDLRTGNPGLGNCTGAPLTPGGTGNNVCENNVPASGLDAAAHQHMTTFTVGLGISGYMQYTPSYQTASSGDYFSIKNGSTANPAAGICSWQTGGACNWPVPSESSQANIDDLWHAAVNGRGTYSSADNPAALSSSLSDALAGVAIRNGASAVSATGNPNISAGNNFLFSSTYTSGKWFGGLDRQRIDLNTGAVSASIDWSAQALLDANAGRTIYTYDPGAPQNTSDPGAPQTRLKPFDWASLGAGERAYFTAPAIDGLTQFCDTGIQCLPAASQTAAAAEPLVNFLRGTRTHEGAATDAGKYFRQRDHVLGDIVSSETIYIEAPLFNYVDADYAAFKQTHAERQGVAYVAANDGMLHAFNADTGAEMWAYVPSLVLPDLYKLADKNYAVQHTYLVDGTPTQADVHDGSAWHTILVGGLNAGGRGYYALDVTNPAQPKALWEFTSDITKNTGYTTDANLGYTFGKPEISKLKDGTWVVLVTSGYNNVPDTKYNHGNGQGYLYVLNAMTGALIRTIPTGVGSVATPSGLGQVRAWADNSNLNNTALRVYGGDALGNLWRFDINNDIGVAGHDAMLLATLRDGSGNAQSMTAKPELGDVAGNVMVYVGTGRYLGVTDLADRSVQSIYAIKDALGETGQGNPRSNPAFVRQTLTATTCPSGSPVTICSAGEPVRTSSDLPVDLTTNGGWFVDLPDSGERATTDPQLALGALAFTTNIPESSACTNGGYSYFYFFDYRTGGRISTSTTGVVGKKLGDAQATRPVFVVLPNNKVIGIVRLSDGTTKMPDVPIGPSASATRRVAWRELAEER